MHSLDELLALLGERPGARVFVRSDLNVPLDGVTITDDGRIRASVPTLQELVDAGARVVVAAHLGRPKGAPSPEFSLRPVRDCLAEHLGREVAFVEDCVGPAAVKAAAPVEAKAAAVVRPERAGPQGEPVVEAKVVKP